MQFSHLVVLALSAAASTNAVSCWKSGPATNEAAISPLVPTICNYLAAAYTYHETRYQCVVDNRGVKWEFSLTHIGDDKMGRSITSAECQDGMFKQIKCQYGGETSYGNWKYRADPNSGKCVG